jgi:hypothetical protein
MGPVTSVGSRRSSIWNTSTSAREPSGRQGGRAAVEAGGLALVEAARAHDVHRALAAAGVARVREAGGQRQHVAQGEHVAADGRHGASRVEPVGGGELASRSGSVVSDPTPCR